MGIGLCWFVGWLGASTTGCCWTCKDLRNAVGPAGRQCKKFDKVLETSLKTYTTTATVAAHFAQ